MRVRASRVAIGVAILVAWCAFGDLRAARSNLWVFHEAMRGDLHDSVAINMQRFSAIRHALPDDRIVGYVSNLSRDPVQDLFLTARVQAQSALAPYLVLDTRAVTTAVGDFRGAPPDSAQLAGMRLRLIHDYGRGVFLLAPTVP
jgi:hypothetical protein